MNPWTSQWPPAWGGGYMPRSDRAGRGRPTPVQHLRGAMQAHGGRPRAYQAASWVMQHTAVHWLKTTHCTSEQLYGRILSKSTDCATAPVRVDAGRRRARNLPKSRLARVKIRNAYADCICGRRHCVMLSIERRRPEVTAMALAMLLVLAFCSTLTLCIGARAATPNTTQDTRRQLEIDQRWTSELAALEARTMARTDAMGATVEKMRNEMVELKAEMKKNAVLIELKAERAPMGSEEPTAEHVEVPAAQQQRHEEIPATVKEPEAPQLLSQLHASGNGTVPQQQAAAGATEATTPAAPPAPRMKRGALDSRVPKPNMMAAKK